MQALVGTGDICTPSPLKPDMYGCPPKIILSNFSQLYIMIIWDSMFLHLFFLEIMRKQNSNT